MKDAQYMLLPLSYSVSLVSLAFLMKKEKDDFTG